MGEARRRLSFRDGISQEMIVDEDKRHLVWSQDVEPTLKLVNHYQDIKANTGDNKYLGTLPAVVVTDLINRGIFHDPDAFDRWWNSTEANPWRVWKGRI